MSTPDELTLLRRTDDPRHYLSAESALHNYIRIADEIAARLKASHDAAAPPRILDWGAGQGQMSFLLARRGLDVASYDVGAAEGEGSTRLFPEVRVRIGAHPFRLPYPDGAFDAVLSCGVLEHVPLPAASLAELNRVTRPGGLLFIYNLPQRHSWPERVREALKMGGTHERRFTVDDARDLLTGAGWRVESERRTNMIPKHLTGLPGRLRGAYGKLAPANLWLDEKLSAIPGLNTIAGLLEFVAVKVEPAPPASDTDARVAALLEGEVACKPPQ